MLYQKIPISCFVIALILLIVSMLLSGCGGMGHSKNDRGPEDTQTVQTVTHEDEINEIIIIQDDSSKNVDPECDFQMSTGTDSTGEKQKNKQRNF